MKSPEKNNKSEKNISPEMLISLAMEDKLREIQKQLAGEENGKEKRQELQTNETEILAQISRRAKEMLRQRENGEKLEAGAFKNKLIKHFNQGKEITSQLEILIEKISALMSQAGDYFSPEQQKDILSSLNAFREIGDKDVLVDKIMPVIAPVIEFQKSNFKKFEEIQRQAFADREEEKFIPIEGTDGIICYGMGYDRVHLHLAPMRSLKTSEKIKFIRETLPLAMNNLAQILKNNPQIESVTATSYIVAASQDLFTDRIGFTKIGPMEKEYRLQYFGDCDMPVLKATMTREEFLAKWVKSPESI